MSWTRNPGRVVGFWYLLLVLGGPLRLIYIPNKLFVHDNAAATASNIAAHELLFRFGMLSDLLGAVVLIFLVLAFYRLFKGVDQQLAVLLVITGGVWLIINGVAFVVLSFTGLFFPDYQNKVFALSQPALFGELAIMLWLVIKSANPPGLEQATSTA